MESENRVEHPNYYKLSNGIEVLDVVRDLPFNIGNVVKYVIRAGRKKEAGLSDKQKQIEDLEKAKFYIEDAIKQLKDNDKWIWIKFFTSIKKILKKALTNKKSMRR